MVPFDPQWVAACRNLFSRSEDSRGRPALRGFRRDSLVTHVHLRMESVFGVTQHPVVTHPVLFQGGYMKIRTLSRRLLLAEATTRCFVLFCFNKDVKVNRMP